MILRITERGSCLNRAADCLNMFNDEYKERYLEEPCLTWDARYDDLPVVDNRLWSGGGVESAMVISNAVNADSFTVSESGDDTLCVRFAAGRSAEKADEPCSLIFRPDGIEATSIDRIEYMPGKPEAGQKLEFDEEAGLFRLEHCGFGYSFRVSGADVAAIRDQEELYYELSRRANENITVCLK